MGSAFIFTLLLFSPFLQCVAKRRDEAPPSAAVGGKEGGPPPSWGGEQRGAEGSGGERRGTLAHFYSSHRDKLLPGCQFGPRRSITHLETADRSSRGSGFLWRNSAPPPPGAERYWTE